MIQHIPYKTCDHPGCGAKKEIVGEWPVVPDGWRSRRTKEAPGEVHRCPEHAGDWPAPVKGTKKKSKKSARGGAGG